MHFMNPVPLMPLVELIRGLDTSDEAAAYVRAAAERMGKTVAEAHDHPGFISNRILVPMINEAVYCLMEGVGDRDSIDTVMRLGMNHPMGPLRLADLIGLDTCLAIMEVLHHGLGDDKYRPCPLLRSYVEAGRLGRKSGTGLLRVRQTDAVASRRGVSTRTGTRRSSTSTGSRSRATRTRPRRARPRSSSSIAELGLRAGPDACSTCPCGHGRHSVEFARRGCAWSAST